MNMVLCGVDACGSRIYSLKHISTVSCCVHETLAPTKGNSFWIWKNAGRLLWCDNGQPVSVFVKRRKSSSAALGRSDTFSFFCNNSTYTQWRLPACFGCCCGFCVFSQSHRLDFSSRLTWCLSHVPAQLQPHRVEN